MQEAHAIVEREILLLGARKNWILYLDGYPSDEKRAVQLRREEVRKKALVLAQNGIKDPSDRIEKNQRIRKQWFITIDKNLKKSFYWSLDSRRSFAAYMLQKEWNVIVSQTEADLKIASDCNPGDVVMSRDSDFLIYDKVKTIWRPISGRRFLVYDLQDVLTTLGLSSVQLTVLGVVSKNDYNSNIPSLGSSTNFGIIKGLDKTKGAEAMVQEYLTRSQVVSKNVANETFATSLKVFVDREQTQSKSDQALAESDPCTQGSLREHDSLRNNFNRLREKHQELKALRETKKNSESSDDKIQRHKSSQTFNRYRTIDLPACSNTNEADVAHPALPRTRTPRHRPRYSFKERSRLKQHEPLERMKQYTLKPWKKVPENPSDDDPNAPKELPQNAEKKKKEEKEKRRLHERKKKLEIEEKGDDNKRRTRLIRQLKWEHPLIAFKDDLSNPEPDRSVLDEVRRSLQSSVRAVNQVQHACQLLVGRYIQYIIAQDMIQEEDRKLLNCICPPISAPRDANDVQGDAEVDTGPVDDDRKGDKQEQFLRALIRCIYSRKHPKKELTEVILFIDRVCELGFFKMPPKSQINEPMEFNPTDLLQNLGTQLKTQFNRHWRTGTKELYQSLMTRQSKGILPAGIKIEIDNEISAIENFVQLNRIGKNRRKLAPMTPVAQTFVMFTERQLCSIFWKSRILQERLFRIAGERYTNCTDLHNWVSCQAPGFLITQLLSNVGRPEHRTNHEGRRGFKEVTKYMSLDEIEEHLKPIQEEDFNARSYTGRGYALRGTIRTDGFRLQLLAFKLKELQSVRYKRLAPDKIPPRISSTTGGVDYFLTEIRNIVKTKKDVADLWTCPPQQIKILGLDLGQACVLGASALLPGDNHSEVEVAGGDVTMNAGPAVYRNLAVKQKAVYQPILKFRRWFQNKKNEIPAGSTGSISNIESNLPPLRGESASFESYYSELQKVEGELNAFYNGSMLFKKHQWDANKAHKAEYAIITDRLLKLIGGSIGRQRDKDCEVVIGVGLGQFATKTGLSSLHGSFLSYFVPKVRSLGYIVVGVNEYYTSKKCPTCHNFVGQVDIRRLYCRHCRTYMHRDVMAGHNICNVVRGHLLHQQRPRYLQPRDENGGYPWEVTTSERESGRSSSGSSSGSGSSSNNSVTTTTTNKNNNTTSTTSRISRGQNQAGGRKRATSVVLKKEDNSSSKGKK
ncbi:hypothetical protein BGX21_003433, partial [Mortierella sp. AD011]